MKATSIHRNERGAIAIMTAIAMIALVGMAALAIDGTLAYNERRTTQNSADQAALAAAWAACTSGDPVTAGEQVAADNGYADSTEMSVEIISEGDNAYRATISSTQETEFAGVVGQNDLTVLSSAVADCTVKQWGGGYALFAAGGPTCANQNEIDFTGKEAHITGDVHSNGDIRMNGSGGHPSEVDGEVTLVGAADIKKVDINPAGGALPAPTQLDPFDIDFSQFKPTPANRARTDYHDFGTLDSGELAPYLDSSGRLAQSGIYYASVEIKNILVSMAPGVTATFVSPGPIKFSPGSEIHFYDPSGVAVYSNLGVDCDNKAIQWTGSAVFTGLIYAPRGEVTMSMASGSTSNGGIMGYNIDLSGSNYIINYTDVTGGGPEYEIELEE